MGEQETLRVSFTTASKISSRLFSLKPKIFENKKGRAKGREPP